MIRHILALLACAIPYMAQAQPLAIAPKTPGERAFMKCYSCHAAIPGEHGLPGPNLAGLLGRKAGSLPDFDYSPALKAATFSWDKARLRQFLRNPDSLAPGTSMTPPPLTDQERTTIIAYLAGESRE